MGIVWTENRIQFFDLPDGRVELACHGSLDSDQPLYVLLHEGLGCISLWRDFPARLSAATGAPVLLWSRLGYGRSDPAALPRPCSYMEDEARTRIRPLLDIFNPDKIILLGHSDGGSIASLYAGCSNDPRLIGLIVIAPHYFTEPAGLAAIAQTRKDYQTGDLKTRLSRYHENCDNAFYGWNDAWLAPDFTAFDITGCLAGINLPVLAIQGGDDPYGSRRQIDVISQTAAGPVTTSLIPQCAHSPHLEHKQKVITTVVNWQAAFCH